MKKLISLSLVSLFAFSMMTSVAFAQVVNDPGLGGTFGLGSQDLKTTLVGIVNVLLGFLGIIAVVVILIGGFKWMTSGGAEEKVASGRQMIIAGVIGLAIILAAFAIVQFVVTNVAS